VIRYPGGTEFWAEPLTTLRRIQDEINRAFSEPRWSAGGEFPPVNIWRGEGGIMVTAEVPGVALDQLDLSVQQNTLTIRGRREPEAKEPEAGFHRRERSYGPFARTIQLPFAVDPDRVKASMDQGILTIEMPRPDADKPRKIHITQL
jgi:HSP20 family protein